MKPNDHMFNLLKVLSETVAMAFLLFAGCFGWVALLYVQIFNLNEQAGNAVVGFVMILCLVGGFIFAINNLQNQTKKQISNVE